MGGPETYRDSICVLHSVRVFLQLSENWIYPQVTAVPNTKGAVLCASRANVHIFPILPERAAISPPPWEAQFGIPRFFNALARRAGCRHLFARGKFRRWRPQLLHAHFGTRGWDDLNLKRKLQVPLLTSFYGFDAWMLPESEPIWRSRYTQLFSQGEAFLVEGPAMRKRLESLGCPPEKIVVLRIGANLDSLPFEARDFSDGLKILMLGRFVKKKGLPDGLRACALAARRGVKLTVTIIGDASEDDPAGQRIKAELNAIASSEELSGTVHFAGIVPLDQTRRMLKSHNVFLCPSRLAANGDAEGGSPVALTEAMASGLLAVGTRHCDIPELIIDGKTGYLCEERDIDGMSRILCALTSPNRLSELTVAARRHVETHFSLPRQMKQLRAVYESFLDGRN